MVKARDRRADATHVGDNLVDEVLFGDGEDARHVDGLAIVVVVDDGLPDALAGGAREEVLVDHEENVAQNLRAGDHVGQDLALQVGGVREGNVKKFIHIFIV